MPLFRTSSEPPRVEQRSSGRLLADVGNFCTDLRAREPPSQFPAKYNLNRVVTSIHTKKPILLKHWLQGLVESHLFDLVAFL